MKKKSLLLSSLALLVVAVIAFTGATYAWFVAGAAPKVDNMRVRVADIGVVKMATLEYGTSWNATTYADRFKNVVPEDDLKDSANMNNPNWNTTPAPLYPVSLNKKATPAVAEIAAGVFSFVLEEDAVDANKNYIKYDLYFSNESTDTTYIVSLDTAASGGTNFFVESDPTVYDSTLTNTANPGQAQIAKSLRLGLTSEKMTATVNPKTVVNGGFGSLVYQPDTTAINTTTYPSAAEASAFWTTERLKPGVQGVSAYPTVSVADAPTTGEAKGMIDLFEIDSLMESGVVNPTSAEMVKLTVYIWIEGNDADCLSGVAGYYFTSLIQFGVREKV